MAVFWTVVIVCASAVSGQSPLGPPDHVTVVSDGVNLAVQWEPPTSAYDVIRRYIVTWAILPNTTDVTSLVDGDVTMTIIAVTSSAGRLYRIRVRAVTDAGIGAYSSARYVRIGCGRNIDVAPGQNVTVTSPGYGVTQLQPGVVCVWNIQTLVKYSLTIYIDTVDLVYKEDANKSGSSSSSSAGCGNNLLKISELEDICDSTTFGSGDLVTNHDNVTLVLKTGLKAGGMGFRLNVTAIVRVPGPPTHVSINTTEHAVRLSWQPPRESTLPITAYNIRYGIMRSLGTRLVRVSAGMRQFTINTDRDPGKVWWVRLSAMIGRREGTISRIFYVRAPCTKRYVVLPGSGVNVTSPGFPNEYPSNVICSWHITMAANERMASGVAFVVTYVNFTLEDTSLCSSDYVTFSFRDFGPQECSPALKGHVVTTHVVNFTITLVTDAHRQFSGFLMEIKALGNLSVIGQPIQNATAVMPSYAASMSTTTFGLNQSLQTSHGANMLPTSTEGMTLVYNTSVNNSSYHNTTSPGKSMFENGVVPSNNSNTVSSTVKLTSSSSYIKQSPGIASTSPPHIQLQASARPSTKATAVTNQYITTTSALNNSSKILTQTSTTESLVPSSQTSVTENSLRKALETVTSTTSVSNNTLPPIASQRLTNTDKRVSYVGMSRSSVSVVILASVLTTLAGLMVAVWCRNKRRHRHIHPTQRDSSIPLHDIVSRDSSRTNARTVTWASPEVTSLGSRDSKMANKQRKQRCYSFPDCFSVRHRKIRRDIKKALASMDFIEDVTSLCATLERKYSRRRTNSC